MKEKFSGYGSAFLTLIIIGAVFVIAYFGMDSLKTTGDSESLNVLKDAIERAAVTCYALEGAYPPDVEYLEEHYGVAIDRERFFVSYGVEGSNLRPDIFVFDRKGGDD